MKYMINPFDAINDRFDTIEKLISELKDMYLKKIEVISNTGGTEPRLIKIDEAAKLIGYKKGYIYELIYRNAIPYIKKGRSIRFDPTELDAWMRSDRPNILKEVITEMKKR